MPNQTDISVRRDVAFTDGERPLLWDVYEPARNGDKRPVGLIFHGGGWKGGDRARMEAAATALAQQGFVALAVGYRLIGEVQWPAPVGDVLSAIRAVRANADDLQIDPDQLFLIGYSAGAHISLLAASGAVADAPREHHLGQSEAVAGVAAFFAPARMGEMQMKMIGVPPQQAETVSPTRYAASLPPTIVFGGDGDPMTTAETQLELYRAIRSAGGVADLRLYSHLPHEFVSLPGMMDATIAEAAAFFRRTCMDRDRFNEALAALEAFWAQALAAAGR